MRHKFKLDKAPTAIGFKAASRWVIPDWSGCRHAAVKYVQQQTIANKRLMEERDPGVRAKNFDELRRIAEDPDAARKYMRRAALLDSLNEANAVT